MLDALTNNYASLAFVAMGGLLSIIALRAVKRWVFWFLLLIAIPCLLIAAGLYWYSLHGGFSFSSEGNFQAALRVGMTEGDVMEAVEKYYPQRNTHRPTVMQNGTEGLGIYIPAGEASAQKTIHLRFEDGRVAEITGK